MEDGSRIMLENKGEEDKRIWTVVLPCYEMFLVKLRQVRRLSYSTRDELILYNIQYFTSYYIKIYGLLSILQLAIV